MLTSVFLQLCTRTSEQARNAPHLRYNLSFWNHLKFGIPSTLIVTAIGLTLIR
ncbi:hypothetical protein SLEP1_g39902 [Rubroshorea leprosula]|uniref:Uncharacterized protein n=1 Tax=Rubroshorea leprosula TaxID=152421 RepID=A0AAV5L1U0_9ROSI|nr:hypothetical protein SLEP1_g39902 [Rubroshorea leprosula]